MVGTTTVTQCRYLRERGRAQVSNSGDVHIELPDGRMIKVLISVGKATGP